MCSCSCVFVFMFVHVCVCVCVFVCVCVCVCMCVCVCACVVCASGESQVYFHNQMDLLTSILIMLYLLIVGTYTRKTFSDICITLHS